MLLMCLLNATAYSSLKSIQKLISEHVLSKVFFTEVWQFIKNQKIVWLYLYVDTI